MEKEFVSSFERRGIKIGKALGEATGIALGEVAGQRKVVLRLLNKRFGELTVDQ